MQRKPRFEFHSAPRSIAWLVLGLSLLLCLPITAGTTSSIAGQWALQADAFLPQEGSASCSFEGTATVSQTGTDLGGSADLSLVNGGAECPAEMTATLDGTFDGGAIQMGLLMGGGLGTADFSGEAVVPEGVTELVGGFDVASGPFSGTNGNWNAAFIGTLPAPEIPTVAPRGLAVLGLLLLLAAGVTLRSRRPLSGLGQ